MNRRLGLMQSEITSMMRNLADVAVLRSTPDLQLPALVTGIASLIGAS